MLLPAPGDVHVGLLTIHESMVPPTRKCGIFVTVRKDTALKIPRGYCDKPTTIAAAPCQLAWLCLQGARTDSDHAKHDDLFCGGAVSYEVLEHHVV